MNASTPLYSVSKIQNTVFENNVYKNFYMNNQYVQFLVGDQTSTGSVTGITAFDNKFSLPFALSMSANYGMIAYYMRHILENNWDKIAIQSMPGIWAPPSPTAISQQISTRFQEVGVSNYYYGDEITNGSFRMFYLPLTANVTGSMTSQLLQNTLRFIDINKDNFGPSFAVTSITGLNSNLSSITSAITVEMYMRPISQDKPGFLWHRWTTFNNTIIGSYNNAGSGTSSAYPFYSAAPNYGIGCYFNKLLPVTNSDVESPYIDFYVYGALSAQNEHYYNLNLGLINEATNTRFQLNNDVLKIIFDGNFHNFKFVWDITNYYAQGRFYIDGTEVPQSSVAGVGRQSAISYSLGGTSSTPIYFNSCLDSPSNVNIQNPSKFTTFGETKHILVFNSAYSGNPFATSAATSNNALYSTLGSASSNLNLWFGFNSVPYGYSALDLCSSFSINTLALTANIINDSAATGEGTIDRVFGLLHDRKDKFLVSDFDSITGSKYQNTVGKIYNNEYDRTQQEYVGCIFYDKGNVLILADGYNSIYGQSTQNFTTLQNGQFSIINSASAWQVPYITFAQKKYVSRKIISITADAGHFSKSKNISGLFAGKDGKVYTRSNKKFITGIVWYDSKNYPLAITKFSGPIRKAENESLDFDIIIDM